MESIAPISFLSSQVIFCYFLFYFLILLPCTCNPLYSPSDYERCAPLTCGNLSVAFPFYSSEKTGENPLCGRPGYEMACDSSTQILTIIVAGKPYQVKDIYPQPWDRLVTVYDSNLFKDLQSGNCDGVNFSASVSNRLQLVASSTNLTLFRCTSGVNLGTTFLKKVSKYTGCTGNSSLFVANVGDFRSDSGDVVEGPDGCESFAIPVVAASLSNASTVARLNASGLLDVLSGGFLLQWPEDSECDNCKVSNGRCAYDVNSEAISCLTSRLKPKTSRRRRVIVGVASAAIFLVVALVLALVIFKFRNKALSIFNRDYSKSKRSRDDDRNVQQFIKSYQSTSVNRYSYSEIRKMTSNFKQKIGEGGYGNVYRGKLADGRLIAVKMLDKSRYNGQDFINEVATIGRIHHVNVIRLLGFCFEGSKHALVYEYMPNGSLGNLISDHHEKVSQYLGWPKLLGIVISIARGIEYLHQGCDTRILHLDIKPQNVLLDHHYNPKISDFGLAKSYSKKNSRVPLTGARGTIGYIAPEIFLNNFGGVSHKSDVYSYGMLLLEIVNGGHRNACILENEDSSITNFPSWIYDRILREREMDFSNSIVEEEEDMRISRKIAMVGLWCIQMNPADRPSMGRVLEMLAAGHLDDIEMPPKPFLFSLPRVQSDQHHQVSSASIIITHDVPLTSETT